MEFRKKQPAPKRTLNRAMMSVQYDMYLEVVRVADREGCTLVEALSQLLRAGLRQYEQERMRGRED